MRLPSWVPTLPKPDISLRDAHAYGGLTLAAIGGWQLSPAWTFVIVGAVLWAMGTQLFARKGKA